MQVAVKGMAHLKDRNSDFTFAQGLAAFKVRVNYTGQVRAIEKSTADFLIAWQKAGYASNLPATVESTFQSEVLVSQGKESFWLPIQTPLLPYLREEYPEGGVIDIYIAGIGALRENLVITINAYDGVD